MDFDLKVSIGSPIRVLSVWESRCTHIGHSLCTSTDRDEIQCVPGLMLQRTTRARWSKQIPIFTQGEI